MKVNVTNISDLKNYFNEIRTIDFFTQTERRRFSDETKVVKVSKGHITYPIVNKEISKNSRIEARKARGSSHYKASYSVLLNKIIASLVVFNYNPYSNTEEPNFEDFVEACLYVYIRCFIGHTHDIDRDREYIAMIVKEWVQRRYSLGYKNLRKYIAAEYPDIVVQKTATYRCIDSNLGGRAKRLRSINERTYDKQRIVTKVVASIRGKKKIRKYVTPDGYLKEEVFLEINRRLENKGFKPYKKTALYERVRIALDKLGVTLKDLYKAAMEEIEIINEYILRCYGFVTKEARAVDRAFRSCVDMITKTVALRI